MTQGLRNSRNTLEAIEGSGQPVTDEKVLSRQKREQAPVQKDVVQLVSSMLCCIALSHACWEFPGQLEQTQAVE